MRNFEKICKGHYYIDKTYIIRDLLKNQAAVSLITRPRYFGKSLNMSMLESFFSVEGDKSVFQGLNISQESELCEKYMGKYPVISFSMKNLDMIKNYNEAKEKVILLIQQVAVRVQYLLESERLTKADKILYSHVLYNKMNTGELLSSLRILSELLEKHHRQKVIVLIDDYDVPFTGTFAKDSCAQSADIIWGILSQLLKSNNSLKFAVLTGCLQIFRESIFTGESNWIVFSCSDVEFDEYFGFTDEEVRKLLEYFRLSDHYSVIKEWYGGFHFGNTEVYCSRDVLSYCRKLLSMPYLNPQNFWTHTRSNDAIMEVLKNIGNRSIQREMERLIAGNFIVKELYPNLTYQDIYVNKENLWSILYAMGYLTHMGKPDGRMHKLAIPNMEIRNIFENNFVVSNPDSVKSLVDANNEGDHDRVLKRMLPGC